MADPLHSPTGYSLTRPDTGRGSPSDLVEQTWLGEPALTVTPRPTVFFLDEDAHVSGAGSERPRYARADDEFALIEALVRARKAAKLTQAELALRLGTTQSAIARLEGGGVSPSFASLRRYAEAAGTRLAWGWCKQTDEPVQRTARVLLLLEQIEHRWWTAHTLFRTTWRHPSGTRCPASRAATWPNSEG